MGFLEWATSFLDPPEITNQIKERRKNDNENWKVVRNLSREEIEGKE